MSPPATSQRAEPERDQVGLLGVGQTIRFSAARGEVVGFAVLVTGKAPVTVQCRLPGVRTELARAKWAELTTTDAIRQLVLMGREKLTQTTDHD